MFDEVSGRCTIEPSFSSKFVSDLVGFTAVRGALTSLTSLSPSAMNREDVRIPCTAVSRVWSAAIEQTGDRYLAMNLGMCQLAYANRTTALESFQLAARYSTLIADVMTVDLGEAEGHMYIEFVPTSVWRQQPEEVQLGCLAITYVSAVSSLSRILGTHQPPTLLSLTFQAPPGIGRWVDVFGRMPRFGADCNRIGFPAELKSEQVRMDVTLQRRSRRSPGRLRGHILVRAFKRCKGQPPRRFVAGHR